MIITVTSPDFHCFELDWKSFFVTIRGGRNRVFGKPCSRSPAKKGPFDETTKKTRIAFYPLKTRALHPRPPKTTKMAGVTQAKAWFRKAGFVLP